MNCNPASLGLGSFHETLVADKWGGRLTDRGRLAANSKECKR